MENMIRLNQRHKSFCPEVYAKDAAKALRDLLGRDNLSPGHKNMITMYETRVYVDAIDGKEFPVIDYL